MEVIKYVKFAGSYSFKYSSRPGTPASLMKDLVEESIADKRLQIIQKELSKQQYEFNNSFLGKDLSVLIEKKGKKRNQYVGRSQYLQPVHVFSENKILGKVFNININEITSHSLHGDIRLSDG